MTTTNVEVKRDEKLWEVEVKAEITPESLDKYRAETLTELQKTAKLDGFRPGKVPQICSGVASGDIVELREQLRRAGRIGYQRAQRIAIGPPERVFGITQDRGLVEQDGGPI